MKKPFLFLLFCYFGTLPAAHAEGGVKAIGFLMLFAPHFIITMLLFIYTVSAILKLKTRDWVRSKSLDAFANWGLVFYGLWVMSFLRIWNQNSGQSHGSSGKPLNGFSLLGWAVHGFLLYGLLLVLDYYLKRGAFEED